MSLAKYIENKISPKTIIIMDDYKEKLSADISSLILKPTDKLQEAKKNIIDIEKISNILSELNYPLISEFCMTLRTANPQKISSTYSLFKNWSGLYPRRPNLFAEIKTAIFNYKAKLYTDNFGPTEVNQIVESLSAESQTILEKMANSIDLAVSKIGWNNHKIVLDAIYPGNEWVLSEGLVIIGENFSVNFVYENKLDGFKAKNINEENAPISLRDDLKKLLLQLQSKKSNKMLTLYMNQPISEREKFTNIKRDLSLGIQNILPSHILLQDRPPNRTEASTDIWKLRVEEDYVRPYYLDNWKYHKIIGECPIHWLEMVGKNEE